MGAWLWLGLLGTMCFVVVTGLIAVLQMRGGSMPSYGLEDNYRDWEAAQEAKGRTVRREGEIHIGPTTQYLCAWCGPTKIHGVVEKVGDIQLCRRHAAKARDMTEYERGEHNPSRRNH